MAKKLFISQPMEKILNIRNEIIKSAKQELGEDVEFIDPFFADTPHDAKPLWFLGKSFELLSSADVAYFADGWEKDRGCRMEHEACVEYNIPIMID